MADKETTAAFLQQQVDTMRQRALDAEKRAEQAGQDMKALISEFANASGDESVEMLRKNLRGRIPHSLEVLDELIDTGADSIRAGIAKWFVDRGLNAESDPFNAETAKLNKLLETLKSD